MQLFVRGPEPCGCGSGETRMRCCDYTAPAEQGGVVWPHYHDCPCEYPFHPLLRPHVRHPASPALLCGTAHVLLLLQDKSCSSASSLRAL